MRLLFRFLGFLFAFGTIVFLVGSVRLPPGLHFSKDCPITASCRTTSRAS